MSEPLTAHQEGHGVPDDVVTYALRGCQYPGCRKETRAYQEFNGLSYCDVHIKEVRAGKRLNEIFATVGTGEP